MDRTQDRAVLMGRENSGPWAHLQNDIIRDGGGMGRRHEDQSGLFFYHFAKKLTLAEITGSGRNYGDHLFYLLQFTSEETEFGEGKCLCQGHKLFSLAMWEEL